MNQVVPFPSQCIIQGCFDIEVEYWSAEEIKWREIVPKNCDQKYIFTVQGLVVTDRIEGKNDEVCSQKSIVIFQFSVVEEHDNRKHDDGR
jgi:hypothetical protein